MSERTHRIHFSLFVRFGRANYRRRVSSSVTDPFFPLPIPLWQLFYRQAQLKPETVPKMEAAVPTLTGKDLEIMQEVSIEGSGVADGLWRMPQVDDPPPPPQVPFRSYDRDVLRTEPLVYRLEEAVLHYGLGT